ncbi:accessory Sec system S-layer assembly protein [Halobacillus locisalis]|uniref:Accessory Sec system S-layer assembly protein n=1 Tax=Halobacillus locisalis TaxID=220753 RepID=A0A838CUV7_9BACI|nr:accessory Sec system S-layer assembly protein [Halobacillus locisalis]MBA2175545.1 accessory Sec system S-layer assembly protein [Halobacillus locisalis]
MFNLFKKKKTEETESTNSDGSTVSASELFEGEQQAQSDELVETELSMHPNWRLSEEETYVYQFMNNDNPPLKPGQISLAGYEMKILDPEVAVGAFVRNSLDKKISFQKTNLLLVSEDGQKLARKEFDLSDLGELPAQSSRPSAFIFNKNDLLVPIEEIPTEGWKLAFELRKTPRKHALDLAESWQKSMAESDITKLEQFVENLNAPKAGEVNFLGVKLIESDEGNLHVTMLIRNGSEKNLNLQQLPLQIEDANGDIVARGGFKLEDFEVKANTSKPWTFIFPKDMVLKEDYDLSRWKAYPIQNQ